jgi:hypothetical protein
MFRELSVRFSRRGDIAPLEVCHIIQLKDIVIRFYINGIIHNIIDAGYTTCFGQFCEDSSAKTTSSSSPALVVPRTATPMLGYHSE